MTELNRIRFEELVARLEQLSARRRLAFALACGERVIGVYEESWYGDHSDLPKRALRLLREPLIGRARVEIEVCGRGVNAVKSFYDEDEEEFVSSTLATVLFAVQCALVSGAEISLAAARAASMGAFVAAQADFYINGLRPISAGPALEEEALWQRVTLEALEARKADADSELLDSSLPAWMAKYVAARRHST